MSQIPLVFYLLQKNSNSGGISQRSLQRQTESSKCPPLWDENVYGRESLSKFVSVNEFHEFDTFQPSLTLPDMNAYRLTSIL
jgi:hypothetical protein